MNKQTIDLTGKDVQGCYGHDIINQLTEPGTYTILVKSCKTGKPVAVTVEVIAVANARMQLILVKTKNGYLDFYYNGNEQLFKHFTEKGYRLWEQWSEENAESAIENLGLDDEVSDNWESLY